MTQNRVFQNRSIPCGAKVGFQSIQNPELRYKSVFFFKAFNIAEKYMLFALLQISETLILLCQDFITKTVTSNFIELLCS